MLERGYGKIAFGLRCNDLLIRGDHCSLRLHRRRFGRGYDKIRPGLRFSRWLS